MWIWLWITQPARRTPSLQSSHVDLSAKPRSKFTEEQFETLEKGMRKYGTSWAKIQRHYPDVFRNKTQVQMKGAPSGPLTPWRFRPHTLFPPSILLLNGLSYCRQGAK